MNIKQILINGTKILKDENIESANLKSRILLKYLLGIDQKDDKYLIINENNEVSENAQKLFYENIIKIKDGYPIEYITNYKEFMKLDFYVDENVLIPRCDTEIVVEKALEYLEKFKSSNKIRVLDLCSGSGAIGISIKKYIPNCNVYLIDISKKALDVSKKNAKINNVNISFIESNLFDKIQNIKLDDKNKFDLIISNPPYIKTDVINILNKDVKNEPHLALDGGEDGLYFYKKIIPESVFYLKKGGALILEIGYDQKDEVEDIFNETMEYKDIRCIKDYYGNDRCVIGEYK